MKRIIFILSAVLILAAGCNTENTKVIEEDVAEAKAETTEEPVEVVEQPRFNIEVELREVTEDEYAESIEGKASDEGVIEHFKFLSVTAVILNATEKMETHVDIPDLRAVLEGDGRVPSSSSVSSSNYAEETMYFNSKGLSATDIQELFQDLEVTAWYKQPGEEKVEKTVSIVDEMGDIEHLVVQEQAAEEVIIDANFIIENLKQGMNQDEVMELLGEPTEIGENPILEQPSWRYFFTKEGYTYEKPEGNGPDDAIDLEGLKSGDMKLQLFITIQEEKVVAYSFHVAEGEYYLFPGGNVKQNIFEE